MATRRWVKEYAKDVKRNDFQTYALLMTEWTRTESAVISYEQQKCDTLANSMQDNWMRENEMNRID
jgi:hypothetical protein